MKEFHALTNEIAARPGAEQRIQEDVSRMLNVLALEKLRTRKKLTQAALAARMGLSQRRVSAIENTPADDLKLDTLRRYIESLGGQLELTAVLDGDRISLPVR